MTANKFRPKGVATPAGQDAADTNVEADATTEKTDTATDDNVDATDTVETEPVRKIRPGHSNHAVRRFLTVAAVAVVAVVGIPRLWDTVGQGDIRQPAADDIGLRADASIDDTTIPPAIAVDAALAVNLDTVLDAAHQHRATTGAFTGFTYPDTLVAATRSSIVVSAEVGSSCLYSGILDGTRNAVLSDPTGQACDPQLVAEAQEALDAAEASTVAEQDAVNDQQVAALVDATTMWSSMTFDTDGQPTLAGFVPPFPNMTVVDIGTDGRNVAVRIDSPESCIVAVVTAGPNPEPVTYPC